MVLILLLLAAGSLLAQTVYVAPTGSDSTACPQISKATPRRSINGGLACTPPGGTMEIADGTYDELISGQMSSALTCQSNLAAIQSPCHVLPNGLDAEHPTTLRASGTSVVISPRGREFPGGGGIITLSSASKFLRFEGLRLLMNDAPGSGGSLMFGGAQHVTVTKGELAGAENYASKESRHLTITSNYIHHAGNGTCNTDTQRTPPCKHGLYICGANHTITDNRVEYNDNYGIQVSCEDSSQNADVRIERNIVRYNRGVGIRASGTRLIVGANVLVENLTGITVSGSGNTIARNTTHGYRPGYTDSFGLYYDQGSVASVVDNIFT